MSSFIQGIDDQTFLTEYWRRKPLFVKGGARALMGQSLTYQAADEIVARAKEHTPTIVSSDPGRIDFVGGADQHSPFLASLAASAQVALGWPRATFDLSRTYGEGSIGCHFDDDDNLTLQQCGVKVWQIGLPEMVPLDDRRRRILEDPELSGDFYLPEGYEEYVLEPGDLLYIPMFAPHVGRSRGDSLSVTLSCDPVTPLKELWPLLARELAHDEAWWRPLDLSTTPDTALLDRLLNTLVQRRTRQQVLERWVSARQFAVANQRALSARPVVRPPATVTVDVAPIKSLFTTGHQVDLSESVLPVDGGGAPAALDDLVGKRYLKRLLVLARDRANRSPDAARSVQAVLTGLTGLPHDALLGWCRRPEVTSWVWQAERERNAGYHRSPDTLLEHLATFALPEILRHGVLEPGVALQVIADGGKLPLLSSARVVTVPVVTGERLTACLVDDAVEFRARAAVQRIPVAALLGDEPHGQVKDIARVAGSGPLVLSRHSWYDAFYPKNTDQPLALAGQDLYDFEGVVRSGLAVVDRHWAPAGQTVRRVVSQVMPLDDRGNLPWNNSVHGFRGLILMSPRGSYLGAQTLCHETAHNRFSTIVDLFPLAENPDDVVFSPFVAQDRPLTSLLHGIFAFLNDIQMAIRCEPSFRDTAGPAIAPYIDKTFAQLDEALRTLHATIRPTHQGERLVHGLAGVFEQCSTAGSTS
jgi:HEXXH motif-containing protein